MWRRRLASPASSSRSRRSPVTCLVFSLSLNFLHPTPPQHECHTHPHPLHSERLPHLPQLERRPPARRPRGRGPRAQPGRRRACFSRVTSIRGCSEAPLALARVRPKLARVSRLASLLVPFATSPRLSWDRACTDVPCTALPHPVRHRFLPSCLGPLQPIAFRCLSLAGARVSLRALLARLECGAAKPVSLARALSAPIRSSAPSPGPNHTPQASPDRAEPRAPPARPPANPPPKSTSQDAASWTQE